MDIRQFRVVIRAKSFERTCRFYGETLALPRLQTGSGRTRAAPCTRPARR